MKITITFWANEPKGSIILSVNGERRATIPSGFEEFRYDLFFDDFDVENDQIQLQSTGINGTCITSLKINENQILVGKNKDMSVFWIDGNNNQCTENIMSTSQIIIQNGDIISSECKGISRFLLRVSSCHPRPSEARIWIL